VTATSATATGLIARTKDVEYRLYVDLSSPELFDDQCMGTVNCCGTPRPNKKMVAKSIGRKMRLEWSVIESVVSCNWTAMAWKDK
jgi:hypothetical protein